jgi:hypothetical protein
MEMQKTTTGNLGQRALFLITLLWGVAIFWMAPHAPLIDLPQHAGQVALLHDLLTGTSPWSHIFRLNLWTPYLIGYGLALPLSFFMSVSTALKVILSLAYIAFVLLGRRLRAHFGADPRLDWLFLPAFFGFAYSWGFYTFLVSSPVVILFILAMDRYAQRMSFQRGVAAMLIGLALLFSHGLAFVFGILVAGCLYLMRCHAAGGQWLKRFVYGAWPLIVPGVACIIVYMISIKIQSEYWAHGKLPVVWDFSIMRIPRLLANATGDYYTPKLVLGIAVLVMFAVPWLLRLRLNRNNPAAWVLLVIVSLIVFFVPGTIISTAYMYQRFSLFALPAYALIFMASSAAPAGGADARKVGAAKALPMLALMVAVWTTFACHSLEMRSFGHESKDFEAVLAKMESKQRVLALTFDDRSDEANLDLPYRHYATWYQSEKQGLVDFNFAWFPPQIVRFRPDKLPKIMEGLKGPGFTVQKYPLDPYRYVVVRHTAPLPVDLFKGADCQPQLIMNEGAWTLFEHKCANAAHAIAKVQVAHN